MTQSELTEQPRVVRSSERRAGWTEAELQELEHGHPEGLATAEVVAAFSARGERLSEATVRKYVQWGLLPRSTRVGRKGKHRGSQGRYPTSIIRRLVLIRELMGRGLTIEDIRSQRLLYAGELEALSVKLEDVFKSFERAIEANADTASVPFARARVHEARKLGEQLTEKLRSLEQRLSLEIRMSQAAI